MSARHLRHKYMDQRQAYALGHPLERASGDPTALVPYRRDRKHATGLLLRTILAVDR